MRAPRFPLQLALRYRAVGQMEWRRAQTANVSASGVLVEAREVPDLNTPLEFRLMLPEPGTSDARSEVLGRGHVVRQVMPPERPLFGFALAIDEYDFAPTTQLGA